MRGFTCGSLLFLSFVFVRGASVLRTDSLVEGLSSFNSCGNSASADVCGEFSFSFVPQLFFSAALILWYCNAVYLIRFRLEP